ncbi:arsenate reductase [Jeongeupia sp. HS-3]|uniref:arsenate reductase (glutaredoxin) n=1 Tax=Jeongeupia sp. HS-3 TaxID=1009682 RepID=UPI0018A4FE2F|nr:arsenate reductase (glutaredoxin) [Jeongeupia sp. HS-3]BCL76834.1 arsenate reductase [Jeongeupia sp. HS-3]
MKQITLYHNPRCSKSRATLTLLNERGFNPDIVDYLATPPDAATLKRLLDLLQLAPRALMRRTEAEYTDLGLDDPALDDATLIAAMVKHPRLIERPIVVVDGIRAAIGRPPEAVLRLLG